MTASKHPDESRNMASTATLAVDDVTFSIRASTFRFAITTMRRTAIPLATEYAIRLIHQVPGLNAEDLSAFFGFNVAETLLLVQDVLETMMIVEDQGRYRLSAKGLDAVSPLGDIELFAISELNAHQTFDLAAFAPIADDELDAAASKFSIEIPLLDRGKAANAVDGVRTAFEQHFQEWLDVRRRQAEDVRFRSIEDVQQVKSFAAPVPIRMILRADRVATVEADYRELRTRGLHGSRDPLIEAIGTRIQALSAPADHDWAFEVLNDVDGGVLRRVGIANSASAPSWIAERWSDGTLAEAKIPSGAILVGSVTGDLCRKQILELAASSARSSSTEPLLWLPPQMNTWGRSVSFEAMVRELRSELDAIVLLQRSDMSDKDLRGIQWRHRPKDGKSLFERCLALRSGSPNALEVIVRPGLFGVVLVHAPDGGVGYPLPIGYATTDSAIVKELGMYLSYLATDSRPEDILWRGEGETNKDCLETLIRAMSGH